MFSSKNLYKWALPGFTTLSLIEKDSQWSKNILTHQFQAQQSVKKVMLIIFWDIKESITINFMKEVQPIVNS